MTETSTIIEAIHYLLAKVGSANKIKLVKLIYLADKYHLIRYGRTLTNDTYFAMEYGPVGSTVKDVLSFNEFSLSKTELEYASKLLKQVDNNIFEYKEDAELCEYEMLSDTDREALEFVIEKFGGMTSWDLSDYTHKYPEWYKHEDMFKTSRTKRGQIHITELLSTLENDPLGMPEKHTNESEKFLSGTYE